MLKPKEIGLGDGSFDDLLPVSDLDATVGHFLKLIGGDGPPGAIESIKLNAAALAINGGVASDWAEGLQMAADAMSSRRAGPADRAAARVRRAAGGRGAQGRSEVAMSFFADRAPGRPGLALFLNCGDPPLDVFRELVLMLDEAKVDCLELAIPFPNSPSDGPVIRESASRALERRRRPRGGARVHRERAPAAVAPEDRAARRLELLDQGHADEGLPRARAGSGRRRAARPRAAAAAARRVLRGRRRHGPADRHHVLLDV